MPEPQWKWCVYDWQVLLSSWDYLCRKVNCPLDYQMLSFFSFSSFLGASEHPTPKAWTLHNWCSLSFCFCYALLHLFSALPVLTDFILWRCYSGEMRSSGQKTLPSKFSCTQVQTLNLVVATVWWAGLASNWLDIVRLNLANYFCLQHVSYDAHIPRSPQRFIMF